MRDKASEEIEEVELFLWNCQIQMLNSKYDFQIREVSRVEKEIWIEDTKTWIRILEHKIRREEQSKRERLIIENVERRYGMIEKIEKQMLNSILERPWKKINIDKVIVEQEGSTENNNLLVEATEVKDEVDRHFQQQFKRRKHLFENMSEEWEKEYQPKEWIKQIWYEGVMDQINEEEWSSSLSSAKENTAPEISGISYILIRKVGPKTTSVFLDLINDIIKTCEFLRKWKVGQIFPIPKMAEWDYALGSTRPIMLLETFRKTLVRIIQKRLSQILTQHKILKGYNFAGLPGESTSSPIYILNNLIEDVKQKNKEIWILLQDIKKAFDSVSLESIKRALRRIKIPESLVRFIIEIFNNRKVKVITAYGLTKGF
jgi:hypothetical protein